jgi:hypothetical protein
VPYKLEWDAKKKAWIVRSPSKVLGRHQTKAAAQKQLRAVYAATDGK